MRSTRHLVPDALARIAENNFFGNDIAFPADAKVGNNVLLATKVMVPVDGPVRENTGLLGSPPFEIPRSVPSESSAGPEYAFLADPAQVARRLAAKTAQRRHHRHRGAAARAGLRVRAAVRGGRAESAQRRAHGSGFDGALVVVAVAVVNTVYSALLERAALGFRRLRPQFCSIYDHYFWTHERLWKVYIRPNLRRGLPSRG